jgi:hypothetical protein
MKVKTSYVFIGIIVILVMSALPMLFLRIKTETDINRIASPSIDDVPREYWAKLAEKKIFFGHQSVGYNIIEGIKDIMRERNYIKLNIVKTREPEQFDQPIFAHAQVGWNTDPASKIEAFENIMDTGVGNKVDIAFFKLCYIDVMRDSNPQQIFANYRNTIEDLKARCPDTEFLHVTVPIRSAPKGLKRYVKQSIKLLIGKQGVLDDNMKRQQYNTLLNNVYSETESLFDLALAESLGPDGYRCYAVKEKERVYFMNSIYTYDGGHLNEEGRKRVAEQLLIILAQMANRP